MLSTFRVALRQSPPHVMAPRWSPLRIRTLAAIASETPQNLVEKIVQNYAVDLAPGQKVLSGDFVTIKPEHVMTHDNTAAVMTKYKAIGADKFKFQKQPVFTLDHDVQNKSEKNLAKYASIEKFAHEHGIDFFPAGRGIGHQILIEEGYAFPYTMTVASDSHSNMYGGVGCLGTPIVRTDAAAIWATGQTWWQVPPVVKVELKGQMPGDGLVTGKDLIIALCGVFSRDEVLNCAIEFTGEGVQSLSLDERLAVSNMTTEWGALVGLFPVDRTTIDWYKKRVKVMDLKRFGSETHPRINQQRVDAIESNPVTADSGARYAKHLTLDLSTLIPHISGPNSVKVSTPLPDLVAQNITINKAYLVSCTNSRASDIKGAADVVRGKKVKEGVEFYVAAASSQVQAEAEKTGDWQALVAAGAKVLPAGCGPCIGLGAGLLQDGEVGISATNRNFKGRMGSRDAFAYLASPAVVAASAIEGRICGPSGLDYKSMTPAHSIDIASAAKSAGTKSSGVNDILEPFPRHVSGAPILVTPDNLNTDAIYPGKYTYVDDIPPEKMAQVVMENHDATFAKTVQKGDILVGGFNFGTGSSREQAATAIKSAGIRVVLAGSFGDIFKRNSINNALVCVEVPELVADLRALVQGDYKQTLTKRFDNVTLDINFEKGQVTSKNVTTGETKTYSFGALGKSVQEVWVAGGLEGWISARM